MWVNKRWKVGKNESIRLAIPTKEGKGLNDLVSNVFARAKFFTFIELFDDEIESINVNENSAAKLEQGTGPIVAKMLKEKEIDVVAAAEYGPGIKTMLDLSGIRRLKVDKGCSVSTVLTEVKKKFKPVTLNENQQVKIGI